MVASGGAFARSRQSALALAQHDLSAAQAVSRDAIARADHEQASAAVARADALVQIARADSTDRLARGLRSRLADAKAVAPAPCAPVVALADSALASADSVSRDLRRANVSLQTGLDSAVAASSRLRDAQVNLSAKAAVLSDAAKPLFISKLIPKPGFGLAAGVNSLGQPQLIVGVTLGWSR